MPKIVKKGRGITARLDRVWTLGDPDWWRYEASLPHRDYEAHARPLVKLAKAVLRLARRKKRRWKRDDDSPESYAQRICDYDGMVRDSIRKGDPSGAARFALAVGGLASEAQMKFQWERSALQGVARREDAAMGGSKSGETKKARAATWQEKIEPKAEDMMRAGRTDNAIALSLAREAGRSADTIRPFLRSLRKKLGAK